MSEFLSDTQVEAYRRDGYVVVDSLIGADQLARLRAVTDRFVEESRNHTASGGLYELEPDHSAEAPRLQRIKEPHKIDPAYREVVAKGPVLAVLRDLLGPDVRLRNSKLNLKASQGAPVEWHQDWAFYPHTNDDVLAVGVLLDDWTPDNGPLMVVPGSHRGPLCDHHKDGMFCGAVDPRAIASDLDRAVPLIAPAGSVSFHHVRLLHGSDVNRSGAARRLLLFEVTAADAWPILGLEPMFADLEAYDAALLCGEPRLPRLAEAPVKVPLPAPEAGSIFAFQAQSEKAFATQDT